MDGPYFCTMCGSLNESVYHWICDCEDLNDWRIEVFSRMEFIFSGWRECVRLPLSRDGSWALNTPPP